VLETNPSRIHIVLLNLSRNEYTSMNISSGNNSFPLCTLMLKIVS
jgi:hypothetical protein